MSGGGVGRAAQRIAAARFEFATQRRAVAIRDRRTARRIAAASCRHRHDFRHRVEAAGGQVAPNDVRLEVAMWCARKKTRRIAWIQRRNRLLHGRGELVVLDPVPDVEQEHAAGPQHAARFRVGTHSIGEKHHAELTHDSIEARIGKRQLHRIGLAPLHRARGSAGSGAIEHRLIQIGGNNGGTGWQTRGQRPR